MEKKNITLMFLFGSLFLLLAVMVSGNLNNLIDAGSFNRSLTSGMFISTTNGFTANRTIANYANVSRFIIFNASFIINGTHGGVTNITFSLPLNSNATVMRNFTFRNNTGNQSSFNFTLDTTTIGDGSYNISIWLENISLESPYGLATPVVNYSIVRDLVFDNVAPNIASFGINFTNGTNFTNTNFGPKILFQVMSNDTTTRTHDLILGFRSDNGTEANFSIVPTGNGSLHSYELTISQFTDGAYIVTAYANDSAGNMNTTIPNVTVRLDRTAPVVSSFGINFTNGTNFTNTNFGPKILFQGMFNDSVTAPQGVRFGFNNGNGTEQNFTPVVAGNGSLYSSELAISQFTDGVYTVTAYVNDSLNNVNTTISNVTVRLDRTPPNVTSISWNNFTEQFNLSGGLASDFLGLNATVNDSTTTVTSVIFGINSTNGTQFNVTAAVFGGRFNVTINLSLLTEGTHTIIVYANDTVLNQNNTQRTTIMIDRTAPSVTVTCSPSNPTAGQTVTCTCTSSEPDGHSGVVSTAFAGSGGKTESTTASGSGTFESSECSASDFSTNKGGKKGSWTVTAASSGGGGAGGGGGGVASASNIPGTVEKKIWASINKGEEVSVPLKNGEFGVTKVSFGVDDTTYGAWIEVKKVDSLPSSVEAYSGATYRTIQITERNVAKVLTGTATIDFKVEKAWLTDNKLTKAEVGLFRNVAGEWQGLPTTVGEEDATYVHYTAQTPGFSYFVIGRRVAPAAEKMAVGEKSVVTPPVEEVPAEVPAAEAAPAPAEMVKKSKAVWVVPLVVLIVVLAVVYWLWGRKK